MKIKKIVCEKLDTPVEVFDIQMAGISPTFICEGVVVHNSDICVSFDSRVWYYDRPESSTLPYEVYPGIHYRCRSSTSPIIKSYRELGIPASQLNKAQKDLIVNQNVNSTSYAQWFERQPNSIKREILGPTRFTAYQNGSLDFDQFYSNGRKLTLKQLQNKGAEFPKEYLRYVK